MSEINEEDPTYNPDSVPPNLEICLKHEQCKMVRKPLDLQNQTIILNCPCCNGLLVTILNTFKPNKFQGKRAIQSFLSKYRIKFLRVWISLVFYIPTILNIFSANFLFHNRNLWLYKKFNG